MAQDLPINRGGADEVLALKPDLVLAGAFGARPTLALLRRLGVPVHEVAIANDLAGICTEINRLALRLGVATRGAELVAELQRRIATPARASGRSAAFYYPNGLSAGANTLPDSLLRMAGLRNAAAEGGLSGYGTLGLENVLTLDPDYLLVVGSEDGAPSRAAALLSHPAIAASFAPSRRVNVAHHYLECGGPIIVELIDRLAAATSSP
jgi:iron complex transport system substrate-binding protein